MTYTAEQIVFWTSVGLLAYVYVGYPIVVYLASVMRPRKVNAAQIEPSVTILITAFNEEASIRQKLENTLAVKYPVEKLEILVASDGSTDRTDDIVREFADFGVKPFRKDGRVGKTETQNAAVAAATGEIILFSDATTIYNENVFAFLLPSFADESVGCVAGRLVYVDNMGTTVGKGAKGYWNYETFLKTAESRACSLIGASGCLYAVRKSAYRPMYPEACSDFLICTVVYRQGLRSVFAPEAVCFEDTNLRADDELKMRIRVISQSFTDLWRNRDMMNPLKSGFFAVELLSHKVLRYLVPVMLIAIVISNFLLIGDSPFYLVTAALQTAFYAMAVVGWLLERSGKRLSLMAMPLYFMLANIASLVAFYRFVRGERVVTWEPIRETR